MPNVTRNRKIPLGAALRALRRERGLSLRALGRVTGFSASFLSQIELEQVSPSLGSLDRVATALGVSIAELLNANGQGAGPILRRRGEAELQSEWSRASVQALLPPGASSTVSVLLVSFRPGGRSGESSRPAGQTELGVCIRGRLTANLEDSSYVLGAGDSIVYDASQPARWRNAGKTVAELLLVTVREASAAARLRIAR